MKLISRIILMMLIFIAPLSAQITGLSGWNIFLDPGHSQKENMGVYGYSEAERNLRVALRLREMLLETTDINTVFISRTNDQQQVSLSQRSSLANYLGAAWYHSIHSNAGAPEYNSTLLLWGQYYNGNEKVPHGGKKMSDIMVDILTRGMRTTTMGSIGDCSFYTWSDWCQQSGGPYLHVNRETTMPSELSESGYHTNPRQNQLFMSDRWKKLEAKTFYWSILKFFGVERPFPGIVTGIVSDLETGVPINGALIRIAGEADTTDTFESLFHKYTSNPELLHNGFYYFDNLPNEDLQMIVEAPEYEGDTLYINPSDTFFTFKDVKLLNKKPPYVVSTIPAHGDTNVPAWDDIIINFSRKMDRASVEENLMIVPEVERTLIWSATGTRVQIRTDTLQFKTTYTITIPAAATDKYNHQFDGNGDGIAGDDFVLIFKTGSADRTPPVVQNYYPPQDASEVETQLIINLTFDETIDVNSVTDDRFKLKRISNASYVPVSFEHYIVNEQSVLCYFPDEALMPGEKYVARLFPGIQDVSGNKMTTYKTFSFQITDKSYTVRSIDNFENNPESHWWSPGSSGSTTGTMGDSTYRSENHDYVNLLTGSTSSLQLNYGWEASANSWLIRMYLNDSQPKNVRFDKTHILQLYVFGDGSGNKLRFCVDDKVPNYAAQNHEVSPWYTIDWIGWKLLSWNMSEDGTGNWIGDGNLDGTLRFDSIQMTYAPGNATSGTVYFDDLQILKQVTTSVDFDEVAHVIGDFTLGQNYPNPFNNNTVIPYQIYKQAHNVRLYIYNSLGQKVASFENLNTSPGNYKVEWNISGEMNTSVTSGIYYYELQVDQAGETKSMIYLK